MCEVSGDTCLCNVVVETEPVFKNWSVPTVEQIVNEMFIGSVGPDSYDKGAYEIRNITVDTPFPTVSPTATTGPWAPLLLKGNKNIQGKGHCMRIKDGKLTLDQVVLRRGFRGHRLTNPAALVNRKM